MSTDIYTDKLIVTRYCGPANEGPDRVRWQFTVGGSYVSLNRDEVRMLSKKLLSNSKV